MWTEKELDGDADDQQYCVDFLIERCQAHAKASTRNLQLLYLGPNGRTIPEIEMQRDLAPIRKARRFVEK
jgi:hypothetical protein